APMRARSQRLTCDVSNERLITRETRHTSNSYRPRLLLAPFEPTGRSRNDQLDGQRVDSDTADREAVVVKRLDVDALEHANEGSWRILAVGPDELEGSDGRANPGVGADRLAIAVVVFVHHSPKGLLRTD